MKENWIFIVTPKVTGFTVREEWLDRSAPSANKWQEREYAFETWDGAATMIAALLMQVRE